MTRSGVVRRVAVLFAGVDTVYRSLAGVDVFDARRDALSFGFDSPVVAHPPCALWSSMRGLAKSKPGERALGPYAVRVVQQCGGVLEHPENSALWRAEGLPGIGGGSDEWGGVSVRVFQGDFGHYAAKPTWLYIVGVCPELVRDLVRVLVHGRRNKMVLDQGAVLVRARGTGLVRAPAFNLVRELRSGLVRDRCAEVGRVCDRDSKAEREATPLAFGQLLVHLARLSRRQSSNVGLGSSELHPVGVGAL